MHTYNLINFYFSSNLTSFDQLSTRHLPEEEKEE